MKIKKILEHKQPDIYRKFILMQISEKDIKECMKHGAWKRGKGGAMRQIRG